MKKTKVLWLTNVPPIPLTDTGSVIGGGWLSGALNSLRENKSIELVLCFPLKERTIPMNGSVQGIPYYGFDVAGYPKVYHLKRFHVRPLRKKLGAILESVTPDILHVFGTELLHSSIAVELFGKPDQTIIHLQGLVSHIAQHAVCGIPYWAQHVVLPSSILHSTMKGQARRWKAAGKDEVKSIQCVANVGGRTEWDEACSRQMNPMVMYFHCGETLRSVFYEENSRWSLEGCQKHSIYFSQGFDQIKGLHMVLPVMQELVKRYPDVHLFIGGPSPVASGFLKRRPYGFYIRHLIRRYNLFNHVTFLGTQNASQVVANLKRAHVFLSSSLIENSPNAVGEALMVGTPVVSSDVGGVKDFIEHGKNGFIYPVDEPYMIPYYVGRIFDDIPLANGFSASAKDTAKPRYSSVDNGRATLMMYKAIIDER